MTLILLNSLIGRRYDGKGDLDDWWTYSSEQSFNRMSNCLVNQYSNTMVPLIHKKVRVK